MAGELDRLKAIGFKLAGKWKLDGDALSFELNELEKSKNVLYALVVAGQLAYLGKSVKPLRTRMQAYKTPPKSDKSGAITNILNNQRICDCLKLGELVEVFALPDNGLLQYGGFHVNLAAGLEDSLVRELQPPWNGGKKETASQKLKPVAPEPTA